MECEEEPARWREQCVQSLAAGRMAYALQGLTWLLS